MMTPWTTSNGAVRTFPQFWYDSKLKRGRLQFARLRVDSVSNTVRHSVVADVDGPILSAVVEVGLGCVLGDAGIEGDRYLFNAISEALGTEGFIGGKIGEAPDFAYRQPLQQYDHTTWRMTGEWVIRWKSGLHGRRWGATDEVSVYAPSQDIEGLAPHNVVGVGPDVFFRVGGGVSSGVMVWNEDNGSKPLVRYPGDTTRAAANLGTDGTDLVWTYGEGPVPETATWTRSVFTAPHSTDPDTVASTARRLRSDPGTFMVTGFAVGCGYAARQFYQANAEGNSANLLIVRLSDGVSWIVEMPPTSEAALFATALGFTCEEVFTRAQFPDESVTIVRIRLDSLGPGMPPD